MNFSNIKKISWFGGSWTQGCELEKTSAQGLSIDQELFVKVNRFSYLVSKHFGCEDHNLAQQGASSENILRTVVSHANHSMSDPDQELLIIVWPFSRRYFWIDDNGQEKDIRYDSNDWWFKHVDTFGFRHYTIQKTMWSLHHFCVSRGLNYVMINGEDPVLPEHMQQPFSMQEFDSYNWLISPDHTMTSWLDFDIQNGYPAMKDQHRYFWPCENHPNLVGHAKIAQEIIKRLEQLSITTTGETNDKSHSME